MPDSTEVIIQRTIDGIQKFLNPQHGNTTLEEEAAAVITINPATKKYCELEIEILQDSPRDAGKLREICRQKKRRMRRHRTVKTLRSWLLRLIH
jgi:hypothetical protein